MSKDKKPIAKILAMSEVEFAEDGGVVAAIIDLSVSENLKYDSYVDPKTNALSVAGLDMCIDAFILGISVAISAGQEIGSWGVEERLQKTIKRITEAVAKSDGYELTEPIDLNEELNKGIG